MRKNSLSRVNLSLLAGLILAALASTAHAHGHGQPPPPAQKARHVDLVIALDTSGSMNGLIDSARQKLWDVVNLLSQARPQPVLRVGLLSYGGDRGYDAHAGWVRKESDLTTDLD